VRNDQVNWRPGTTSVFESIWNLRRKLSFLNQIGKTLTCEVFKSATSTVSGNIDLENSALKLLGEPLRLFRSSSLSNFLLSDRITVGRRRFSVGNVLRYCSVCISRGYHSAVHQLPWVALCPIHLIPLIDRCAQCGKPYPIDLWETGKQDLKSIGEHPDRCCCNLWPGMTDHAWPDGYRLSEVTRVSAYLRWLDDLKYAPEIRSAKAAFGAFYYPCCDKDNFVELFHIWRHVTPPPKGVEEFLISNPIAPPVVQKIIFPSDDRAEIVRDLVEAFGYEHFEDGVICQFAHKGEMAPWEYFAKRVCKSLTGRGRQRHGNCHQVLQKTVKRKYLRGMFIDVISELKWICPKSELLRMIRSPTLTLDKRTWPAGGRPENFDSSLIAWFDDQLIQLGLAEIASYRDKLRFRRVVTKSLGKKLQTKAIWTEGICQFSSRIVMENHAAASSRLLKRYTEFFQRPQRGREEWKWHLKSSEVRWPYILVSAEGRALYISIWRRSARIDDFSLDQLHDGHSRDIKSLIRRINREVLNQRRRELDARAVGLSKLLQYSSPATNSSSGE
jgi:hypothetical protein